MHEILNATTILLPCGTVWKYVYSLIPSKMAAASILFPASFYHRYSATDAAAAAAAAVAVWGLGLGMQCSLPSTLFALHTLTKLPDNCLFMLSALRAHDHVIFYLKYCKHIALYCLDNIIQSIKSIYTRSIVCVGASCTALHFKPRQFQIVKNKHCYWLHYATVELSLKTLIQT